MEHINDNKDPRVPCGSVWTHHRKLTSYKVLFCTNIFGDDSGDFAIRVVYVDSQGRIWSRKIARFLQKFIRD